MLKQIDITYIGTPDLATRDQKSMTETAMVAALRVWHRRFLLRHFYVSAESKYKYTPRTKKYLKQKKGKFGHTNPLVKTGAMRKELMSRLGTRTYNFKRKGRARATMWARVLNLYSKPTAAHDIKREIVEMTDLEVKQLMQIVQKGTEALFKKSKAKKTVSLKF